LNAMLTAYSTQARPVNGDQRLHPICLSQQLVPLINRIAERIALALSPVCRAAAAHVPGIMMKRPTPHSTKSPALVHLSKESPAPIQIPAIRPRTYEGCLDSIFGNPFGKPAVLGRI